MQEYEVSPKDVGLRADVFVTQKYPQFARAALSSLFNKQIVLINKHTAKAGQKLKNKDVVSLDESKLFMQPEKIELPIIYEDDNVVVLNKPAGILTHSN
jgi:23S rRNA pseudouridine1911/1915/1917 synthase